MAAMPVHLSPPPSSPGPGVAEAASPSMRKASLYVGDLHPDVTEEELQKVFGAIGPLISVRLCRDRVTRHSLCYAYVNFTLPCDASMALSCLNHTKLKGKTMRIMWCLRDPLVRKNGAANLYVKNLVPSVTGAHLEEIFGKYGTIVSCKVAEENGMSKGFGFVQFDSEDSATTALSALNGTMLEGKELCVCRFVRQNGRVDALNETFTNLYFKNLDEDVTEDFLEEKFSDYGKVCNLVIMKDDEGKSKGFGFVNFSSHEEAKKAMECLNGAPIGSKVLFVGKAQKKAEREEILKHARRNLPSKVSGGLKDSRLFVKNFSLELDDNNLESLFSPFGKVTSARVIYNEDGTSKGFGFVSFSRPEEAKRALDFLNGTVVQGRTLLVDFAQGREKRGGRHLQRRPAEYPEQPFYPSCWNIFVPQYQPLCYNFPPPQLPYPQFSIPQLSSLQPTLYENFSRAVCEVSPFIEERCLKFRGTTLQVPRRQAQQEPTKAMSHQYHLKSPDSSQGSKQGKQLSKQGSKNAFGNLKSSITGSGSGNPPAGAGSSLQWVFKKKLGKMLPPCAPNLQIGHLEKRGEVLVEMDRQKLQKSQNPLAVPVEKAIQMIGATSGTENCSYSSL